MRFKLQLEVNKRAFGNRLPINYQYEQSSAIYRILARADKDYATWLHENGLRIRKMKKNDTQICCSIGFLTEKQALMLKEAGLNRSDVHVDFMIGSNQMDIDGIRQDGSRVPIFRNGDWVI